MRTSPRLFAAAITLVLLVFVCSASADGLSLKDRIMEGLSEAIEQQAPKPTKQPVPAPTKRPTAPPTNRPTKTPTPAPTKKATKSPVTKSAPTKKATKSPVAKPTKGPVTAVTKAPAAAPTKKATKVPVVAPTKTTKSPVAKTTKSPVTRSTKVPVSAPTKTTKSPATGPTKKTSGGGKTTASPSNPATPSPSATTLKQALINANSPATDSPTPEVPRVSDPLVVGPEPPTSAPSEAIVITEAPSDPVATAAPSIAEAATEAPSKAQEATDSPKASEQVSEAPTSPDSSTSAPSTSIIPLPISSNATEAPTSSEATTNAPVASPDQNSTAITPDSGSSTTTSPAVTSDNTSSPSPAPTAHFIIEHALDVDSHANATSSPTMVSSTHSPTTSTALAGTNQTSSSDQDAASNITLKSFILSALNNANGGILSSSEQNWTALATEQLYRTKRAGVTSRALAIEALLALQRACAVSAQPNVSMVQISSSAASIQATALPELRDNKRACDDLLKMREASMERVLREKVEFASASCAMAIRAHEHLYDVSAKIVSALSQNSSILADYCASLVTPQLMSPQQYDTSAEAADTTTSTIILASLGLALGLLLLVLHPLPGLWGTTIGFIVSSGYSWGYVAFTASWYAFNLSEPDAWVASTWWRNYYSTYLLGLAGWLIMMCLCSMLYMVMVRNSWMLGMWSGIAIGIIFGVQLNTIGLWALAYPAYSPWFTLACCMGAAAFLWLFVLSIASGVSPTQGMIQHLCMVFIGSYLFVKTIGVLVGSYPNEFDMSPPIRWETYVYISCMWVLAIIAYIVHAFAFGISAPRSTDRPAAASADKGRRRSQRGSSHSSALTVGSGDEDKVPLHPPVGSAADSRNQARQQEVSEFGGVRALRPDSENRRLYV